MFQNQKFADLVDNVFSKIDGSGVQSQLEQLYITSNCVINTPKYSGKYFNSRLFKTYCEGNNLKTIKHINYKVNKINTKELHDKIRPDIKKSLTIFDSVENTRIKSEAIKEINVETGPVKDNDGGASKIMDSLTKLSAKHYIQKFTKDDDYYSIALVSYLSNIFNIAPLDEKIQMLKQLKLDIITKFNKETYYKNYDYSIKHFKKAAADETFADNRPITMNMTKIYGDICNINIVHITESSIKFITKFNPKNAVVIINDRGCYLELLMTEENFVRGDICQDILGVRKQFKHDNLIKLKLDDLQNIAKMKNFNIKKTGKTGKINVTKDELISLICEN